MPELTTNLAGTPLVFAADDARLLDALGETLTPLRVPGPAPEHAFRCTIASGTPPAPPADAAVQFEGIAPFTDSPSIFAEHGEARSITFPGRYSLIAMPASGHAAIVVKQGEERLIGGIALMHLLDWVLEAHGRTLLHGAALADLDDSGGVLIFAPSGAGKTTTALALMKAGFRLYSDDLAVLDRSDGETRISGLARPLKVHRNTAEMMPWLKPLLGTEWDEFGEQPLTLEAAESFARPAGEPRPLRAIVRLAGHASGGHALRAIPGPEALIRLCEDNLRSGRLGMPESDRRNFRRLGAIVAGVPAYDLIVGPDPQSAPTLLLEALAKVRA